MRLFVAIELPGSVKDELARVASLMRDVAPDAKWVPRDNLHLTLSFLGEVPEDRISAIEEAVAPAASAARGIHARLGSTGAFPSARRARVLWVALDDEAGSLAHVAETAATALGALGFRREARPWTSHVTLARFRTPGNAVWLVEARVQPLTFDVAGLTIYRSRLGRPAPVYEAVSRLPRGVD